MKHKMKPLTYLLAALVLSALMFTAMPRTVLAAPGATGTTGIWNWRELSDGTLEVTSCTNPTGSLTLPDTLGGKTVTRIADSAFLFASGITGISLPSTLKNIEANAFSGCTGLQSIAIPAGVLSIGSTAFGGCVGLETATLPNGLQSLGDAAFNGCGKLASITIPDTVTSIGETAFTECSDLESVTLPDNPAFTVLKRLLFGGCTKLNGVVIPASVTTIEEETFLSSGITAITIPANVASIGLRVFRDCRNLMSIQADPSNTHFESADGVLYTTGKTSLVAYPGGVAGPFAVPDSVINIATGAFNNSQNLTGVTLTDHVQTIGDFALAYSGITEITIPKSVTSIGLFALGGCTDLKKAVFLCKSATIGMMAFNASGIAGDGIYGFTGSTAQTYATDNVIPFHLLYTVSFQGEGTAVDDTYVETGHTFGAPAAPTRSGYVFSGWYKDGGLSNPWTFATDAVTADITLHAKWIPVLALTPSPADGKIHTGNSITITPNVAGGTWNFDGALLSRNGNEFTGLTAGTAHVTYTAGSQSAHVDVVITNAQTPSPTATPPPAQLTASPANGKIFTGGRITITPNVPGGTWDFDTSLLSRDGNIFTGLKAGTTRVTYTVDSQSVYMAVVITQAGMPQTGQDFSPALWLMILAVCLGGAALITDQRRRRPQDLQ